MEVQGNGNDLERNSEYEPCASQRALEGRGTQNARPKKERGRTKGVGEGIAREIGSRPDKGGSKNWAPDRKPSISRG